MANLLKEVPVVGELEYLAIFGTIAANPDVACSIDVDPVFYIRPVVSLTGAAPGF